MDKKLLESKMKLFGDSNVTLAKFLKITPQTLSSKKNGKSEFKMCEMMRIKEKYKLTSDEVNNIFFA